MKTLDIPISAAKAIAEKFGYHQVVIIARAVGPDGREHCTTYGIDKANCDAAARGAAATFEESRAWKRK